MNSQVISGNTTAGMQTLESRGLNFDSSFYWISIGALIGFTILFNAVFILALTFLKREFFFPLLTLPLRMISRNVKLITDTLINIQLQGSPVL